MKVKRFIATFLAVALVFAMAACSATADNSTSSKPSNNTTSEAPKESTSVASKDDDSSTKDEATTPAEDEDTTAPEEDSSEAEDGQEALKPAKTSEDSVTDEELEEMMTYIAKSVSEEYLVPNGINPEDLVWPTDPNTFRYFDQLFTNFCIAFLTEMPPDDVREDYIPASPDKDIMDAVFHGVTNWLDGFESYSYEYLLSVSDQIDHLEYILEYIPANINFDSIDPEASPEPDAK